MSPRSTRGSASSSSRVRKNASSASLWPSVDRPWSTRCAVGTASVDLAAPADSTRSVTRGARSLHDLGGFGAVNAQGPEERDDARPFDARVEAAVEDPAHHG